MSPAGVAVVPSEVEFGSMGEFGLIESVGTRAFEVGLVTGPLPLSSGGEVKVTCGLDLRWLGSGLVG